MSTTVELPTPTSSSVSTPKQPAQPISRFNLSPDDDRYALPHVVIIGGGFGGLTAARTLKGAPGRGTLLDRHHHSVFQPLLYQGATAGLSPGDIASPIRWILRHQRNVRVLLGEATAIDV